MHRNLSPIRGSLMIAAAVIGLGLAGCGSDGGGGASNNPASTPGAGTTPGAGAGQIQGATFASATSRQLWSGLTLPSTRTMKNRPEPTEPEFTSTVSYSADTQRGIDCVKIEEENEATVWMAKDTQGRVVIIQIDEDGVLEQPATIDDTQYIPTQGVAVGQSWITDSATKHNTWQVMSINATAPRNGTTGCTLLRITTSYNTPETSDDDTWYIWWSNAKGVVEEAESDTVGPDQMYHYESNPAS